MTGVSKAKADPEKTVTRIAMDGLLADILGLGSGVTVALFDISISDIDCRYIDT